MNIEIVQENSSNLTEYASIPIAFRVSEVIDPGSLEVRAIESAYVKNYDEYPGHSPVDWPSRFDTTRWGFFVALDGDMRIGGAAVVAHDTTIEMLEGREDLAVLWDLRVAPSHRRGGVATMLLAAAESWAREHGARELKVETQNINVAACRFYERSGFMLGAFNPGAYSQLPDEVQFLWYKRLI